jgi:hypothetical protein
VGARGGAKGGALRLPRGRLHGGRAREAIDSVRALDSERAPRTRAAPRRVRARVRPPPRPDPADPGLRLGVLVRGSHAPDLPAAAASLPVHADGARPPPWPAAAAEIASSFEGCKSSRSRGRPKNRSGPGSWSGPRQRSREWKNLHPYYSPQREERWARPGAGTRPVFRPAARAGRFAPERSGRRCRPFGRRAIRRPAAASRIRFASARREPAAPRSS